VDLRAGHRVGDELRGQRGDPAQAALLPAADEPPDGVVVLDGRPRGRERQPPARALAAPRDRPDGRSSAALADRRDDDRKPVAAPVAQLRPGLAAGEASLREEQIEQASTLAREL
jgi:hypothetical protein